jgi:hypothetical protein
LPDLVDNSLTQAPTAPPESYQDSHEETEPIVGTGFRPAAVSLNSQRIDLMHPVTSEAIRAGQMARVE